MKKFLPLLTVLLLLIALTGTVGAFTYAEEADVLELTCVYNNEDYVEFGEVDALAVSQRGIAARETDGEVVFFGGLSGRVSLADIPSLDSGYAYSESVTFKIAMFDSYLIVSAAAEDGAYLFAYDAIGGEWSFLQKLDAITDIAVDADNSVLVAAHCNSVKTFKLKTEGGALVFTPSVYWSRSRYSITSVIAAGQFGDEDRCYVTLEGYDSLFYYRYYLSEPEPENDNATVIPSDCTYYPRSDTGIYVIDASRRVTLYDAEDAVFGSLINSERTAHYRNWSSYYPDSNIVAEKVTDESIGRLTAYCFYDGKFYAADGAYGAVKVYSAEDFSFIKMYGNSGTSEGRLNSPTAVSAGGSLAVVADTGNDRLVRINTDDYQSAVVTGAQYLDADLTAVCSDGRIFAANSHAKKVFSIDGTYEFENSVTALAASDDRLFAVSGQSVFVLEKDASAFALYAAVGADISDISAGGDLTYVRTVDSVLTYKDGARLDFSLTITEAKDMFSDYAGNLYLLCGSSVKRYQRNLTGFDNEPTVYNLGLEPTSFAAVGDKVLIVAGNRLYSMDSSAINYTNNSGFAGEPDKVDYPVAIIETADDLMMYSSPDCYQNIADFKSGARAMLRTTVEYDSVQYYYIEYQRRFFYLPVSDSITILSSGSATVAAVKCLFSSLNIYNYPDLTATTVKKGLTSKDIVKVTGYVAVKNGEDAWGWYSVEFDGVKGYVQIADVVEAEEDITIKRYYLKACADYFGTLIKVYDAPSEGAEVLDSLTDGAKLELRTPFDANSQYVEIWYNERPCYVKTSNVTDKTLTNSQVLAVVLFAVTVAGGALILVMYFIIKKRREKNL